MAKRLEPFAGGASEAAAECLIRHFGGLGRALSATPEQLRLALPEHGELVTKILAARSLIEAGLHERITRSRVDTADPGYQDYLRLQIGGSTTECLHVTFVTSDRRYLGDERMANGSPSQVDANLRALLSRAFDLGASGIILAHNHPSGSSQPSPADIRLTRRIAGITRSVEVLLLDHLIVGADAIVSMKERGLL